MAKWVIADDREEEEEEEEESSSSSEEDDDSEDDDSEAVADEAVQGAEPAAAAPPPAAPSPGATIKQRKLSIKLGGADVCHVCGKAGHTAGFVGAKYIDCPNKPCYLCGKQGHSTMTCPFRIAPGHGCTAAAGLSADTLLCALRKREQGGRPPPLQMPASRRWQVDAAVLKLHSRRTTCLEFHPTLDHLVLSGDKRGQIAVWDHVKVYERTVYPSINRWLTNGLRFMPGSADTCASSSYDGTVKVFDVETGCATTVMDANPQGWDAVESEEAAGRWVTLMGLDVVPSVGAIVAGDNFGRLHFLDPRMRQPIAALQTHKRSAGKVQCVHCNPADHNLVMSAGNDYTARVMDIRNLMSGSAADSKGKAPVGGGGAQPAELAVLQHKKVINAAYFSPVTGRKILTTSQDNRLRVWDYLYATQQPADREIVHSQNFNRYLTPFKAEWDPKDLSERLIVVGRYISEDFGGLALHPVDLLDAATGALVGELTDPNLTTICPVNKPHPRLDLIVSGSSRSLYAWRPAREDADGGEQGARSTAGGDGVGGLPLGLQGSSQYIFFDADPDVKKKGGKKGGKAATASAEPGDSTAAGKAKPKSTGAAGGTAAAGQQGGDDAGPSSGGKGRKRSRGAGQGPGGGDGRHKGRPPAEDDSDDDSV